MLQAGRLSPPLSPGLNGPIKALITAIAFIVCLDSSEPSGLQKSFRGFLLGNGNRENGYDMSLQII